ncbi:MAG: hypothetical protein IPO68_16700 [Chitinophagaceae bacterium]|nr:hypothetical protein [Chitinophagaceae bacterium]
MSKSTAKKKEKETSPAKLLSQKKKEPKTTSMIEDDIEIKPDPFKMINSKSKSESKPSSKRLVKSNSSINLIENDDIDELLNFVPDKKENQTTCSINSHKILNNGVLIEYLDSAGKKKNQEIQYIEVPKFKKLLKDYITSKNVSKKDEKTIIERWEKTHSPDEDDLPEIVEICDSKIYDPLDIGGIDKDLMAHELDSLDIAFPKYFQKLIDKQTDPFMKHLISLGDHVKTITYLNDGYKLEFDFDGYFKGKNIPKNTKEDLRVSAKEMYHPIMIFNMHQFARFNGMKELEKVADSLFEKYYQENLKDIERRLNIINGAIEEKTPLIEYMKNNRVAKFIMLTKLDDTFNVYGFRREVIGSKLEGYIKYYEDRERGRYLYFSFSDIHELMGEDKARIFINKVYRECPNEESKIRDTVEYLKAKTLYKKGKIRLNSKFRIEKAKKFDLNNSCFINALVPIVKSKLKGNMGFKYKYTGKTLEQQIAMINESGLGFILSERNEISGKLKEVYDSIDVKCILVFKTSDFISHSVPVLPGEEYTDYAFDAYADEIVKIRIVDVHMD